MPQKPEPRWYESRQGWYVWRGPKLVLLAKGKGSKREAWAKFNRLMLDEGNGIAPSNWTVQALADVFLEHCSKHLSRLTIEWYTRHLQSFVTFAGKIKAEEIRPFVITRWLDSHDWGRSTRHGAITAVKRLYRWAKKEGHLDANPVADVDKPGIESRANPFTGEQLATLLDSKHCDQPLSDILIVLRETGMRPSEAMRLSASCLDLPQGILTVKTKARGLKTRVVYLTDKVAEILSRLAKSHPTGPLLRNSVGTAWTRHTLNYRLYRRRGELGGKDIAAGGLRHGFATDALLAEVPIATVAELMGHKSTAMIEKHYSHLKDQKAYLKNAVKRVRPDDKAKA